MTPRILILIIPFFLAFCREVAPKKQILILNEQSQPSDLATYLDYCTTDSLVAAENIFARHDFQPSNFPSFNFGYNLGYKRLHKNICRTDFRLLICNLLIINYLQTKICVANVQNHLS